MLFHIIGKAFLGSLEAIGQSPQILIFSALTIIFLTVRIWRTRSSGIKEHVKKTLETIGTCFLAWLPFFFWSWGYEARTVESPSVIRFPVPTPPIIQVYAPPVVRESKDSLRRRTIRLADEMQKYFVMRATNPNRPPFAVPNSNEPNPSDEQKKAIERYRAYEQETWDFYFARYKDRMIGIIKEHDAKGVRTGYLESSANQRPPVIMMPGSVGEGTYMDDLYQFRELAYHVDGAGNLIVITP
jgi:hypothetical protein